MDEDRGRSWWFSGSAAPQQPISGDRREARNDGRGRREERREAAAQTLPSISLPTGGGAIRGIDEKLTVDQATGTARLAVPVFTSPGREGFGPQLSLSYDSGAGNGAYGLGWSLSTPSITRKTSKGLPRYDDGEDSDVFIVAGAEDLVPRLTETAGGWIVVPSSVSVGGASFTVKQYRPRVESSFARIERWQDEATGDVHWHTVSRDNVTSLFGQSPGSRIADPDDPGRVFSWLLDLSFDDRGNVVSYTYKPEDATNVPAAAHELGRTVTANQYVKNVFYGNRTPYEPGGDIPSDWCFQVVFDYGEHDSAAPLPAGTATWPCRPDPFSSYRAGFEVRTYRLCRRVLMFHLFPAELGAPARIVRSTDLAYTDSAGGDPQLPQYSLLASVTHTGWLWPTGAKVPQTAQLPPVTLTYSALQVHDGLQSIDGDSARNLTGDFAAGSERWVDLASEGLSGILTEDDSVWYYKHNRSAWDPGGGAPQARFSAAQPVATKPRLAPHDTELQLTSLNGNGRLCAATFAPPVAGWSELAPGGDWEPMRTFAPAASIDWTSPNLRFLDIDGDGLADVLLTEDDALTWYPWVPDTGFAAPFRVATPAEENEGPAIVFADGTGSIFTADMTGDGLSDLVRVRNGEVAYWPNLGYGRFGPKVVMDGAPLFDDSDVFDPRRIRLADIDGSGTADLAYVGSPAVTIWFNQSGNAWTVGRALPELPGEVPLTQIGVFDLLGTGTAAAVWTSPLAGDSASPLRYIDLTGATKPYLLSTMENNLGARTTLTYAPSTRFYVQAQETGSPWITRLPFPVHVVAQMTHEDGVSRTSVTSTYTYHHGFYDPTEREFRGFARVDQLDAEALPEQSGIGTFTGTPPITGDEFTLPPVLTRTWFHTGAYFDRQDIAARLAAVYYAGDAQAPHLADTALPLSATGEELREACRALRGRVLRQEIYGQDGPPAAADPYTTTEHRYEVDQLQPPTDVAYGAYYACELEQLTCHYERVPTDPCVTHELTLTIDGFGNVTSRASVGYSRRRPAFSEQGATLVRYDESDFTNTADQSGFYRVGVPIEQRHYELTGVTPSGLYGLFDHDALQKAASTAPVLSYEQTPVDGTAQRRLLGRSRTIYRADDLSGPLPRGQVESRALVDRSYRLTYTPGLLSQLFTVRGKISAAALATALSGPGAFVDLDGDGNQWAPSARMLYSSYAGNPDPVFAAAHFYLPQGSVDPWGNVSTVTRDAYDLLVTQTTDAAGNTTSAQYNYRVLAAWLATDANLNRTGFRFDELGMITATAQMGKLLSGGVDEGDHVDTTTAEASPTDDPTARIEYDLTAYQLWAQDPAHDPDHPTPASSHTLSRVEHKLATTQWIETYRYTDGFGRVALTKAQAEPGVAPARDATGKLLRDAQNQLVFAPTGTRWIGTGQVVYDNKGNPVKAYEPFFDSSPVYDDESDLVDWGVTAITRYDPLGRAIRIDNPDGSYRTGAFDAWQRVDSDEDDTVLGSDWYSARSAGQLGAAQQDAAQKAAAASLTPTVVDQDPLGRSFQTVADNGPGEKYATVLGLDIDGQVLQTTDALGRTALTSDYCPSNRELHRSSIDSGERWTLYDAGGQHLLGWDSRQHEIRCTYDPLRRPTGVYVTTGGGSEVLAELIVYGETVAGAQGLNLRGAVYQHQDGAGVATTDQRDFKGNILQASRRLLVDYTEDVDWSSNPALSAELFPTSRSYDALNRVVTHTAPDGTLTTPTYNARSLLTGVTVSLGRGGAPTTIVESVTYDAKGQRLTIAYGNTATTAYSYDPETFRLTALTSTRPGDPGALQALTYAYDPVGNITQIADAAQQTTFFNNQVVSPAATYSYDAIYRLTAATGREQIGQAGQPQTTWSDAARTVIPSPADGQAMRNYAESYSYDPVGNLLSLAHTANLGNWTRTYSYDEPTVPPSNNHLTSASVGGVREPYGYDPHGNVDSMPHLSLIEWDWKDQLRATASQIVSQGAPPTTYYSYDGTGQRIVKATNSASGVRTAERVYLGSYEVYREYDPTGQTATLERHSIHVGDGAGRICLLETTTIDANGGGAPPPSTATRYQLSNHLGSAVVELDENAALISYEEFYPYGSTSFQTGRSAAEVSLKRYRYAAKERDAENGFYYHGARYYAPWLGRWTACDPAGFVDGVNVYAFVRNNPVRLRDPSGRQSEVDKAKDALAGAKKEKEEAGAAFEELSGEARRLEDRYHALVKHGRARLSVKDKALVRQIEQHDFPELHAKLVAAGTRQQTAEASYTAAAGALAQAERDAAAPKPPPSVEEPKKPDTGTGGKPTAGGTTTASEDKKGDAKWWGHVDLQYLHTYNFSTSTASGFESDDAQLAWIPDKDWSLGKLIGALPENPKFAHEFALTLTRSTQSQKTGTEQHYEPGLQFDVIDYELWKFEGKATVGVQSDLYQLQKAGDLWNNTQLLGQASVAFKLFEEANDGHNHGLGLDLGVQVQKGLAQPGKDFGALPWSVAGGATLHVNW